jgi:hypothetical protein
MKPVLLPLSIAMSLTSATAFAFEGDVPHGQFGHLDRVFLIMMENQTNTDILGSQNAPFINAYAKIANQATNYFAVGHPSAPNYLEIVGGSNFGVPNDYWPNWTNDGCTDNSPGSTGCVGAITPIAGSGTDNTVVATAMSKNDCNGQIEGWTGPVINDCALYTYPATTYMGKSIAHQLVQRGGSWKTYQESLPMVSPQGVYVYGVNYADGAFSNLSPAAVFNADGTTPPPVTTPVQKLYAVKHNPFAYFADIEAGADFNLSLARVVDFDGPSGLWADLRTNNSPNLSFIVPNQCHDMHGFVSGGPPICSSATPAEAAYLMQEGDAEVAKIVSGIKNSNAWRFGRNAIVLVWDENDYGNVANRVVMLVDTNYAQNGRQDNGYYDHYSLLRTMEAGFGLPCLNHACDGTSKVMDELFGFGH